MRRIEKILRVEQKLDPKTKKIYFKVYALLDGDECQAFAPTKDTYKVGDECEVFFDDRWNVAKFQKSKPLKG